MIIDREHIDSLIARNLSGEASETERMQLERWMDESQDNQKYFTGVRFVNEKVVASHRLVKVDVSSAWDKVQKQMKHPALQPTRTIKPVSTSLWLKIAASIVLALGLSFWLLTEYHSSIHTNTAETLVSNDKPLNYQFSDHTHIRLNKNSKITYSKLYGKKQREVNLSGEAFFEVRHLQNKPFIVNAEGTTIQDIGTSFTIKAYPDSSFIRVFVKTGEVLFYTSNNEGIRLTEGETGTFDKTKKVFYKTEVNHVNSISPQSRIFNFQNAPLPEVIQKLNSAYGTNIRLNSHELSDRKITVSFNNEKISSIITIISETLGLKAIKTSNGYTLCPEE